jgi:SAM-dependent methyltransferase
MTVVTMPDLSAVKGRQQQMWSSGDFAQIGATLTIVGETISEAADVRAGQKVLDVAAGAGNAAVAAARRFANVTASDYVPALLERGRERAAAERLPVTFVEGDAEALPFADGSFDVVLSTFGVMFAPNQEQAASELLRVCRPGGTIGLLSWTPQGFIGRMFGVMKPYAPPPPPGAQPPPLWGDPDHVKALLGDRVTDVAFRCRTVRVELFEKPGDFRDYFKSHYGPTIAVYDRIADDPDKVAALDQALADLARRHDRGTATLTLDWEYLLLTARRRP